MNTAAFVVRSQMLAEIKTTTTQSIFLLTSRSARHRDARLLTITQKRTAEVGGDGYRKEI